MIRIKDITIANREDILYFMYDSNENILYIYIKNIPTPLILKEVTPDDYDNIVGA